MGRPLLSIAAGVLSIVFIPSISVAGNNALGSASLSWDAVQAITNLPTVPTTSFPMYIHLNATPDVRELALHL